jgi:hypothetical protein
MVPVQLLGGKNPEKLSFKKEKKEKKEKEKARKNTGSNFPIP